MKAPLPCGQMAWPMAAQWLSRRVVHRMAPDYVPIPPEFKPALCEQMNRHPDVAHVFVSKRG